MCHTVSDTRHSTLGTLPSKNSARGFTVEVKVLLKMKLLVVCVFICHHIFVCSGMTFASCIYNRENRVHVKFMIKSFLNLLLSLHYK